MHNATALRLPSSRLAWTATAKHPPLCTSDQRLGLFHGGVLTQWDQGPESVLGGQSGKEGKTARRDAD
jgi:hypothetical protein